MTDEPAHGPGHHAPGHHGPGHRPLRPYAPGHDEAPPPDHMPRRVKVFGIAVIVLIVVVLLMHLAGGSMGGMH
ncbi:hypothetical protein QIS99_17370 [Streptomyces sp. B-S-A8]|uniref:Uncharacterized protein n=1 Tax=Streptomyces solicavernae TaxID=3043614 RepID=A0ABT6RU98_9ACTN|nr:hypothetical protein [Streptomyces sp. B-S-A8]MDI3387955.1 hypothetical protein [Streptomyces sp. B-S-A8]